MTQLLQRLVTLAPIPVLLLGSLAIVVPMLAGVPLRERAVNRVAMSIALAHVASAVALAAAVLGFGAGTVEVGRWYGDEHALRVALHADVVAASAVLLNAWVGLAVLAFARRYLHKESGHARFFTTALLALACLDLVALAGSLDLLFVGWELLGLCSFLLIAFFHEREETVERGLRAIYSYRVADLGLLGVLVLLQDSGASTDLAHAAPAGALAAATGLGLAFTAAGKTGLPPFSGWLARSVEGPTPSSALFYGGLSVAAGPWLLLRAWPLYEASDLARGVVVGLGLLTALSASSQARARSDVKGAIVLGGLAQNGLVVAEIGLGLHLLAGVHLAGNVLFRTWQLLRSPSVLHLQHARELATGTADRAARRVALPVWLLARFGFEERLVRSAVQGVRHAANSLDRLSRRLERLAIGERDGTSR